MANAVYDKARQKFLEGNIAWLSDTIKIQLVNLANYTYASTHEFLSSVPAGARVSTPQTLGSKTSTNGNALGGNLVFPSVAAIGGGASIGAYVVYKDTGTEATSPLIAFIDTATGIPVTPNGGTINVVFSGTRIFRI